jgi:hypothetical protein
MSMESMSLGRVHLLMLNSQGEHSSSAQRDQMHDLKKPDHHISDKVGHDMGQIPLVWRKLPKPQTFDS